MASINFFKNKKITIIGLEVAPQNSYSIGCYSKLGFYPSSVVVQMYKKLGQPTKTSFDEFDTYFLEPLTNKKISLIRKLSGDIEDGLDYSKEAILAQEYELGKTIALEYGNRLIGFAICHAKHVREALGIGSIRVLLISTKYADNSALSALLTSCERYLLEERKKLLLVPVYAAYTKSYQFLLSKGYKVGSCLLRMVMAEHLDRSDKIWHLSSLSG